jgi:hypothetical protein
VGALARIHLAVVLARLGRFDEAIAVGRVALAKIEGTDRRAEGAARAYLAMIFVWAERYPDAEREAQRAAQLLTAAPPLRAQAIALVAASWLARGHVSDAVATAREAMDLLGRVGRLEEGESLVRFVWAQALYASGERDSARAAILVAREQLLARASKISDERLRNSFLTNVPENAQTLEMAVQNLAPTAT